MSNEVERLWNVAKAMESLADGVREEMRQLLLSEAPFKPGDRAKIVGGGYPHYLRRRHVTVKSVSAETLRYDGKPRLKFYVSCPARKYPFWVEAECLEKIGESK